MQANIQEIYATAIRPLTSEEKLRIATMILEEVIGKSPANGISPSPQSQRMGGKLSDLFGAASLGQATGVDNEQIDADLAREYADDHIQLERVPLGARERREAMDELLSYAGAVSSGNPRAADNEAIDADLAREYGKDI